MTEIEARERVAADVPRETLAKIERFIALLLQASQHQNLISAATIATIWQRHILDSVQLLPLVPAACTWLDIGTGAGFPGVIVALASDHAVTLLEPRGRRASFLRQAVEELGLNARVGVAAKRAEQLASQPFAVISARAVAPLATLFNIAAHLADTQTSWVLPKGRSAALDVAAAAEIWHGRFTLVPSVTDPDAAIVVARSVRPKEAR